MQCYGSAMKYPNEVPNNFIVGRLGKVTRFMCRQNEGNAVIRRGEEHRRRYMISSFRFISLEIPSTDIAEGQTLDCPELRL
jgi:hypothetical protein